MQILIEKDSATKVPRDCSLEDAHALVAQGFVVYAVGEDGSEQPLPELAPADESPKAAKKSKA